MQHMVFQTASMRLWVCSVGSICIRHFYMNENVTTHERITTYLDMLSVSIIRDVPLPKRIYGTSSRLGSNF